MIRFVGQDSGLLSINPILLGRFEQAQAELLHNQFGDAAALCRAACDAIHLSTEYARGLDGQPVLPFADQSKIELLRFFGETAARLGVPPEDSREVLPVLVKRIQLLRAFADPGAVVSFVTGKIKAVAARFPVKKESLERGSNPGDVLDPYIITAAQYLLYRGEFGSAMIEGVTAHKALMMIEDLVGHLHEDVIGQMRGNVRVPEPGGKNRKEKETLDSIRNPFPGADLAQPPWQEGEKVRLYQVKNKTGSSKGGDGRRLGEQLELLRTTYGAETYYAALVGKTLQGHRSMAGVRRVSPSTVVLVGQAAFKALTGSPNGAELLLSVYQDAFVRVAKDTGYDITRIAKEIAKQFERSEAAKGEDFSTLLLHDTISGPVQDQDSRLYVPPPRKAPKPRKRKGHPEPEATLDEGMIWTLDHPDMSAQETADDGPQASGV